VLLALALPAQDLRQAVAQGQKIKVEMALMQGQDINQPLESDKKSLLSIAAISAPAEMLQFLLDKGAAIDHQTEQGWTALMLAAGAGPNAPPETAASQARVKVLLQAGANFRLQDKEQRTALQWAEQKKNVKTAQLIKKFIQDLNGAR
jgi:ankyrin repeat protein